MTSALMGYISYRRTNSLSRRLYGCGVLFALSHYVFGYYVSPPALLNSPCSRYSLIVWQLPTNQS